MMRRFGPTVVRELSWTVQRSLTVADNYSQGSTEGVGPVSKAVFQGFACSVAFSDDSKALFGQTQEGGTGTIRVPLDGIPRVCLTGYLSANEVYNNLRSLAQYGGVVVSGSSTGALVARAFDADTMDTLPGWVGVDLGVPNHACETDGLYGYFGLDGNPGAVECVAVRAPSSRNSRFRWQASESWQHGVYSMSLDPHRKRLAIASNDGIVYLLDTSPLHGGQPAPPRLLASWPGGTAVAVLPGADRLFTLGLSGPHDVATWDITDPGHPIRIGSANYTGDNPGDGYGTIHVDAEHDLLYCSWPRTQDLMNAGVDVLLRDDSGALSFGTTFRGYQQGPYLYRPDYSALSRDGKWYAFGSGGAGAPGGFALYDVSACRDGGEGRMVSEIPANAETRGAMMNDDDAEPHIYTVARYHLAVSAPDDTLQKVLTPGYVTGNKVLPFGTTARGVVPDIYLVPGQGFEDVVIRAAGGELGIEADLGNSTFQDADFDGKHLVALRKSSDYYNAELVVHEVLDDFTVGRQLDRLLLPADKPFSHGTVAADGVYGTPGARIWVAADPIGVCAIDAAPAAPGHMDVIASDPVYHPIETPHVVATTDGSPDNAGMLFRFTAYYLDEFDAVLGISAHSDPLRLSGPENGFQVTLAPHSLPLCKSVNIGGAYSWDGVVWFGPSPVPETVGLPPDTVTIPITSSRAVWFGQVPQSGAMFPSAGSVLSIVPYPDGDRVYVSQGDEGVRVYRRGQFLRTAQLLGYTHSPMLGIAAPGMDLSTLWNGGTLASMHYTSLGSGNGIRFFDVATDPDDPPFQHIATAAAGFTCTAIDARGLVLANTVAGPVALTCLVDTWEPCPEPPDPCRDLHPFLRRYRR